VSTLQDLLALRGADLQVASAITGASLDEREPVTGYQGLSDLDAIDASDGVRLFVRDDKVVLVYVGESGLPNGITDETLAEAVGSSGEPLPSRQGKLAELHVVAEQGIAWSEVDGEVGFVELFPPTDLETYLREIYQEPPKFIQ